VLFLTLVVEFNCFPPAKHGQKIANLCSVMTEYSRLGLSKYLQFCNYANQIIILKC